jgi:hypothetical protein
MNEDGVAKEGGKKVVSVGEQKGRKSCGLD